MEINDFENTQQVSTTDELREFLSRRYDIEDAKVNSFWIGHEERYPCIGILVKDDLARVDYLPDGERAGYRSVGSIPSLLKGEMTLFYLQWERQPVANDSIITFDDALRVAEEFLHSKDLPKCITWMEL